MGIDEPDADYGRTVAAHMIAAMTDDERWELAERLHRAGALKLQQADVFKLRSRGRFAPEGKVAGDRDDIDIVEGDIFDPLNASPLPVSRHSVLNGSQGPQSNTNSCRPTYLGFPTLGSMGSTAPAFSPNIGSSVEPLVSAVPPDAFNFSRVPSDPTGLQQCLIASQGSFSMPTPLGSTDRSSVALTEQASMTVGMLQAHANQMPYASQPIQSQLLSSFSEGAKPSQRIQLCLESMGLHDPRPYAPPPGLVSSSASTQMEVPRPPGLISPSTALACEDNGMLKRNPGDTLDQGKQQATNLDGSSEGIQDIGKYTTVVLQQINQQLTKDTLARHIANLGFAGGSKMDFLYYPSNFENRHKPSGKAHHGYAIVNFVNHECASEFMKKHTTRDGSKSKNGGQFSAKWANMQGFEENVFRYLKRHDRIRDPGLRPMIWLNGNPGHLALTRDHMPQDMLARMDELLERQALEKQAQAQRAKTQQEALGILNEEVQQEFQASLSLVPN